LNRTRAIIGTKLLSDGGAIALGHPLGASGMRPVTTALLQLARSNGRDPLCRCASASGKASP
jgi:acetyl-CoA acyltransferase